MANVPMSGSGLKKGKLDLDPIADAETCKAKIIQSILDQVAGADRVYVTQRVSEKYDRLLAAATVTSHIPVLVEGEVRAEMRSKRYRHH